jgi:hypothetical protein
MLRNSLMLCRHTAWLRHGKSRRDERMVKELYNLVQSPIGTTVLGGRYERHTWKRSFLRNFFIEHACVTIRIVPNGTQTNSNEPSPVECSQIVLNTKNWSLRNITYYYLEKMSLSSSLKKLSFHHILYKFLDKPLSFVFAPQSEK